MNKETKQAIKQLQNKVKELQSQLSGSIYAICEQLDYHNSSNFSYNIDRLNAFVNGLIEFEPLPTPPTEQQEKDSQVL